MHDKARTRSSLLPPKVRLHKRQPAIPNNVAEIRICLGLADDQRTFGLEAESDQFIRCRAEIDDDVVQRLTEITLLERNVTHCPIVDSGSEAFG